MDKILNRTNRAWLYGISAAVIALLVGYDIIGGEQAPLWLAVVGGLLGVAAPVVAVTHLTPADPGPEQPQEPERLM